MDWTHKQIAINDIRKIQDFYVISVDSEEIEGSLLINQEIFEDRIKSYFLKDPSKIKRKDILNVEWNIYATKGYYIKAYYVPVEKQVWNYDKEDHFSVLKDKKVTETKLKIEEHTKNPDKWYVSYLEIDGPLGAFEAVINKQIKN